MVNSACLAEIQKAGFHDNTMISFQNTNKGHPTACLWDQGMKCPLWVHSLIYILHLLLSQCMQCPAIIDYVIKRFHCMCRFAVKSDHQYVKSGIHLWWIPDFRYWWFDRIIFIWHKNIQCSHDNFSANLLLCPYHAVCGWWGGREYL